MWLAIQIAAYAGPVLGYGLLWLLAMYRRAGRDRAQLWLEVSLLLAALWTVSLGLLWLLATGSWWEFVWRRTAQVGLVILALHTANFAEAFAQRPAHRWLSLGLVAPLALGALALDAFPVPFVYLSSTQVATWLLVAAWFLASAWAWWACVASFRHAIGAKHRNRLRYLGTILLIFVAGDLLVFSNGVPHVYVGLAARLVGFSLATFAVLRFDLPDIRQLTLTAVRVAILSLLTACLYLAGLTVAAYATGAVVHLPYPVMVGSAVAFVLLLVAVLDVTLGPRLQRMLDRTIFGEGQGLQRALRLYSERINLILDLERLADTTLDWLRTSLRVERSAFILFTPQKQGWTELRVLRGTHLPLAEPQSFRPESRFILHFHHIGRPLSQYDLDMLSWFQSMPAAEGRWLKALAVDLYVPVLAADRCVALLALGPKASEQPYSAEELESLMILAGQTGTALENARLMDDLRAVQNDLQRLNAELAETNRQLQRLDQTKADFINIASHELRTPLTQISGYSEVLAELQDDELHDASVVQDFVEGISRGASRLKRVVDAILDMSLLETGTLILSPATLSLDGLVQDAADSVRSVLTERNQSLILGDLSGLPPIEADGARLEQALVSVLINAVKFTPDGGKITISGGLVPSTGDTEFVELRVADSGIGVDPEHQDLIFSKFYRAENPLFHSTDASRFKGAGPGLGLPIAKGIVEAHGGRIWVESPGRDEQSCPGSTFCMRLPVAGPEKDQDHGHPTSLP